MTNIPDNLLTSVILEEDYIFCSQYFRPPNVNTNTNTNTNTNININNNQYENIDESNETQAETREEDILFDSKYFILEPKKKPYKFDRYTFFRELILIFIINHFILRQTNIFNVIINIFTVDAIINYIEYYTNDFLNINYKIFSKLELLQLDRYIYCGIIGGSFLLINYISWFIIFDYIKYLLFILITPTVMGYIYNMDEYKKIRDPVYEFYNELIQKNICKQLAKIINLIITNVLKLDVKIL